MFSRLINGKFCARNVCLHGNMQSYLRQVYLSFKLILLCLEIKLVSEFITRYVGFLTYMHVHVHVFWCTCSFCLRGSKKWWEFALLDMVGLSIFPNKEKCFFDSWKNFVNGWKYACLNRGFCSSYFYWHWKCFLSSFKDFRK